MKTFKGSVKLDFKVVITDLFVADMRHAAQQDDASPFLKMVHAEHPVNDEAFIERVIKNGIRIGVQHDLGQRFSSTEGMGGSVSPGKIELVSKAPEHDADATPQVLDLCRKLRTGVHAADLDIEQSTNKQAAMAQAGEIY